MGIFWYLACSMRLSTYFRLNIHAPQCIIKSYLPRSFGKSLPETMSIVSPLPTFLRNRLGIFTRPISSVAGAWVQASAINTLDVSVSDSIALALLAKHFISPLYPAKSTENEVRRLSAGVFSKTYLKACESVIISFGIFLSTDKDSCIFSGVQLTIIHFLSSSSRIVCTCGSMSLPFGACASCGITSITKSPSATRSPVMLWEP